MEVKDIIRQSREKLGLTMKEVANKIGVSEGTISRWESGNIKNMKRDKIAALSGVLDIPIESLMGWDEKLPPSGNSGLFRTSEDARIAKEMYEDKEIQFLYRVKKEISPEAFSALVDYIKKMYELELKNKA